MPKYLNISLDIPVKMFGEIYPRIGGLCVKQTALHKVGGSYATS